MINPPDFEKVCNHIRRNRYSEFRTRISDLPPTGRRNSMLAASNPSRYKASSFFVRTGKKTKSLATSKPFAVTAKPRPFSTFSVPYSTKITLDKKVEMVGIIFSQPEHFVTKEEILPNLDYYNYRSGKNINFYFSGYGTSWSEENFPDKQFVIVIEGTKWYFSPNAFNKFRKEIESFSKWKYCGEVELLLINAITSSQSVDLNFSSCVTCNLDEMMRVNAIPSIKGFFEQIFQYAEQQKGTDPTWDFSDQMGLLRSQSALKRFILSLLPKNLGKEAERISHFAVRNVSR